MRNRLRRARFRLGQRRLALRLAWIRARYCQRCGGYRAHNIILGTIAFVQTHTPAPIFDWAFRAWWRLDGRIHPRLVFDADVWEEELTDA